MLLIAGYIIIFSVPVLLGFGVAVAYQKFKERKHVWKSRRYLQSPY